MRNVLFKTGKIAWRVLKKTVRSIVTLISFIEAVTKKERGEQIMAAEVETMFYTREKPWHGLGVRVENALSSKEALIAAGLDLDVEQRKIYTEDGYSVHGYFANVRSSDNHTLGTEIQERGGKFCCNDRFSVATIAYNDERAISSLSITNNKYKVVYVMGSDNSVNSLSSTQIASLKKELVRTGVTADEVKARYNAGNIEDMPGDIYKKAMSAFLRTKSAGAA